MPVIDAKGEVVDIGPGFGEPGIPIPERLIFEAVPIPGPPGPPGLPGPPGTPGGAGPAGQGAFTDTTAGFTQPAVGFAVPVDVLNTDWLAVGAVLFVEVGGYYEVGAINTTTQVTLINLGYTGNLSPGGNVPTGQRVVASGPATLVGGALAGDVNGPPGSNVVSKLQGNLLVLGAPALDDVLTWDGTKLVFGPPVGGVAFNISSFSPTISTLREVGESLPTVSFTASYSVLPTGATIYDNQTMLTDTLLTPFAAFTKTGPFTKTANGQTVLFALTTTRGVTVKAASVTFTWALRRYYGNSSSAGPYDAAFISALAQSSLGTTASTTFTSACGVGEHIYFALPSAYSTPVFYVGGFEGGFELVASAISVTVNGIPTTYDIWRTVQTNLSSTTVTVS
jgi:hypothetical protein